MPPSAELKTLLCPLQRIGDGADPFSISAPLLRVRIGRNASAQLARLRSRPQRSYSYSLIFGHSNIGAGVSRTFTR